MGDRTTLRGQEVAFDRIGTGAVDVVLVHGFQNDRTTWSPLVVRLDQDRFRLTTFDLVGCGESSRPTSWERCTIDEYAADLLALCDELGVIDPIVVGHSLGGGIAMRAALDDPERFSGLILVAPVSTTGLDFVPDDRFHAVSHPTVDQQRVLARAAFRRQPPEHEFDQLMAVIARATPEHIEGAARSMRDFHCIDDIAELAPPTLLICGDRDAHVPLRNHLATHQAIRRCGLQVYFDVGHVPFVETPDALAADAVRFIDTVLAAH